MRHEIISATEVKENDILYHEGYRVRATRVGSRWVNGEPTAYFQLASEPDEKLSRPFPVGYEGMNSGGNARARYGREIIQFSSTSIVRDEERCYNKEDGEHFYQTVWLVVIHTTDLDTFGQEIEYVSRRTFYGEHLAQEFALTLKDEVYPRDWNQIVKGDPNELPDYVTDWSRPEFN